MKIMQWSQIKVFQFMKNRILSKREKQLEIFFKSILTKSLLIQLKNFSMFC